MRNLGQGFVNFGEPITLSNYLSHHYPEWKEQHHEDKPLGFNQAVGSISNQVMININKSAAVNGMNLVGTALLSSRQRALSHEQLLEQLSSYQEMLKNVRILRIGTAN